MKRSLLIISFLSLTAICFSQNLPTLLSWQVDTMCQSTTGNVVHTIQVQDLDADDTYIIIDSYDPGDFVSVNTDNPAPVGGQLIRTFTFTATASTGLTPGLNLSNIAISIFGNVGNDGGYTTELITNVPIYGNLGVTADFSALQLCANGNPVDISSYATPAGGQFSWVSENGYMFDPQIYFAQGGTSIDYYYVNGAGCTGGLTTAGPTILGHPTVTISPSNSTCGNSDGSIMSFISGGQLPYNIYWSTGFSETVVSSPSDILNLSAGNYYANVTDVNGCKAVGLAQISDIEVDVIEVITDETCMYASQDGSVLLTIVPTLGSVNFIYWSNGQQGDILTNVHKGEYLVEVRTTAGCEANASYFVSALPTIYVSNANSIDAFCSNSDGAIDYDILGGSGAFSFLWNTGATSEDLFGVPSGTYKCVVTDISTSCTMEYEHNVYSMNGPGASVVQIIEPKCGMADGMINIDAYQFSAPVISVSWDSGQTTEDLTNVAAGEYVVTVTDLDGCIFNQTIVLENAIPVRPEICMLTVDTSLIYNEVVWEKDLSQPSIAGYNIYRETSSYGVFELVANRPYALESFYEDNDASPVDRSWRYQLSSYDDCGNESYLTDIHKTIHIVTNTTNSIDYNISWDNYEGMNYASVDIFRFDSTNGWASIGNVLYGTNTFADTPPVLVGLDYMAQFNLSTPCTSAKAQDHNSSRSNKTGSIFNPGGSTAQIEDEDLGFISIYPNPASDIVTLHVDKPELFQSYEITNLNGEIISTGIIYTNNTTISTEHLAAGVYMIRLISTEKIIVEKLMKN